MNFVETAANQARNILNKIEIEEKEKLEVKTKIPGDPVIYYECINGEYFKVTEERGNKASVPVAKSHDEMVDYFVEKEGNEINIELSGDDMGVLIGKRGQTLDSLQYLTSLVVNKGKSNYIRVKLDTEDYRRRRKDTLENLAKGIAFKVKKTRKAVVLEPMNPYERRIIHSALQGNKFVETISEGEEPYRHVVVKMKRF